jgi:hypothetical protein
MSGSSLRRTGIVATFILAVLPTAVAPTALASTLSVNCDSGGDLQAKIDTAASGSTILVKGTCFGNFVVDGKSLTLKGNPTATLDGNDLDRTLEIDNTAGKAIHLIGLTITGGTPSGAGGGISKQAGLLTLNRTRVTGNLVQLDVSGGAFGGGIYNSSGNLIVSSSTISDNRALGTDTATDANGGGIYINTGNLTLINSLISGNRATDTPSSFNANAAGGGIYVNSGKLVVKRSTVSGNRATASGSSQAFAAGGGLYGAAVTLSQSTVNGNAATSTSSGGYALADGGGLISGSATVAASTISRNVVHSKTSASNQAAGQGGGFFGTGAANFTNSTIALNKIVATSPNPGGHSYMNGGGIYMGGSGSLVNTTVAGNTTAGTGATVSPNGGGIDGGASVSLKATIVANNIAAPAPDCSGGLVSHGYNLIRNSAGCSFTKKSTDRVGKDPKLGPLSNNGGPTQTMPIALSSPARDAIPKAACAVSADQRGVHRPQGPRCDIGAYERKVV